MTILDDRDITIAQLQYQLSRATRYRPPPYRPQWYYPGAGCKVCNDCGRHMPPDELHSCPVVRWSYDDMGGMR